MTSDTPRRRLSAILMADVVGYSAMMQADELGTLAAVNTHRDKTVLPAIASHDGRVVKLIGDGVLAEFASVVDAVTCAITLQQGEAAITLRIGVNLGDVIMQGDDIYGDGVNIAARLEALAEPGGICVSSVVRESIGGRVAVSFVDGGAVQVKGIERPLQVWHWSPGSEAALPAPKPAAQAAGIAVLPFDNMSGDAEQAYFSDGISEDIITDLSKVSGLTVIARNSSFAYRGRAMDLRQVGRELGVSHVLEGSVRRAGNRVRITAQLIDAANGGHLWAERYDRDLADIFAVQDEVTLEIVQALKVHLKPGEKARIEQLGTSNVEAHDHYLRLRRAIAIPTIDGDLWRDAVANGERAIALDPAFIAAHATLAVMHVYDFHNQWSGIGREASMARAKACANRAIALDPASPAANHALAIASRWDGDLGPAARAIDVTLSATPDDALSLFTRAEIWIASGRSEEAIPDLERAIRLDPALSHLFLQYLGAAHLLLGHFETAALTFRERLLMVPGTDLGRAWLASALGHLGETDEARRIWAELMAMHPGFDMVARLERQTLKNPADPALVMAGLAAAGLP